MSNRPLKNYDYGRAGIAMVTLKTIPGIWLCRITQESFKLTEVGQIVHEHLKGINNFYSQVKIGQYQIMPDHLHAMVHIVKDLPKGVTLHSVFRGFKLGVNRGCRERFARESFQIFKKGLYASLIFTRAHLQREVAYVRDNVRRYRMLKANPELFQKAQVVMRLEDGLELWGLGNRFLLKHPRRVRVQFSRSMIEAEWQEG